jgi:hypothetical protein
MNNVSLQLRSNKIVHTVTHFMNSQNPLHKLIYNWMKILMHKNNKYFRIIILFFSRLIIHVNRLPKCLFKNKKLPNYKELLINRQFKIHKLCQKRINNWILNRYWKTRTSQGTTHRSLKARRLLSTMNPNRT